MNLLRNLHFLLVWYTLCSVSVGEVWEKDMSEEIYIEASHDGFRSVELSCGKKNMVVEVKMEEDFDGVIYTRGSFMTKYLIIIYYSNVYLTFYLQIKILFSRC